MTYQQVKHLKIEEFKRLCGVRPETFTQMVEVVRERLRGAQTPKAYRHQKRKQDDQEN
ncbi:hypothetical protein [Mastigocladopsis repens]|uniref:hypothetical protein n=1 Tax=Mastigocladopsis repens TaxID=221287 RepID=UPI0002DCAA11|nr:hypothetical protein [Mastigocladopsis repens]